MPTSATTAARAFALASKTDCHPRQGEGPRARRRALLELVRAAVHGGDADFGRMDDDPAFDPIREDPQFVALMKEGHPDRRYAAVWSSEVNVECKVVVGLKTAEQLQHARELMDQGYHPVAWSVARMTEQGPLAASVWHRPVAS